MARARNIKPGFFKDSDLADAGPIAQLLFAGLWCLADKDGRLKDKPREIKAEIFPYYDADVNGELTVLERLGHVRRYSAGGIAVIEVINFKKHQSPHHTERASELPAYDLASDCKLKEHENNESITVNSPLGHGGNPPDSLIPDSLIPDSLIPDSLNKTSCAEQQAASPPKPPKASFDYSTGHFKDLSSEMIIAWREAYPAIDVRTEIAKAKAWMLANPKNRKSNIEKFLTNWLSRAQDSAPRIEHGTHQRLAPRLVIDHNDTSWAEGLEIPIGIGN